MTATLDRVFISYETKDGLNLARLAKMRLGLCGHQGWVWQDDRNIGEYTRAEIAQKIIDFEHFLYICTKGSHASEPQEFERELSSKHHPKPVVIAFSSRHVSPIFEGCNQIRTTNIDFQRACDEAGAVFCKRRAVKPQVVVDSENVGVALPKAVSEGGIEQIERS